MSSTFLGVPVLCSNEKNRFPAGESKERGRARGVGVRGMRMWWPCKSSPVESRNKATESFGYFAFFLNSSKHHSCGSVTMNSDDLSIFDRSEFRIPSWYTSFKIALYKALAGQNSYTN